MNFTTSFLIILGMFIVTFGVRFVLFARAHKVVMPLYVERALKFVPVAVLTSIITPMMFMPESSIDLSIHNPWLLGGIIALVVGIWQQRQLLTIIVGVIAFFAAKYGVPVT